MSALTEKQTAILDFIKSHIANHGFPPSQKEIARHMQYKSVNAVSEHLKNMAKKRFINVSRGISRGIKVL